MRIQLTAKASSWRPSYTSWWRCQHQRVALKDHLEILQNMLILLRANIFRVPIKDLEFLLRDVEIAVIDVGLLAYSLYEDEEDKEDMAPGGVKLTQVLDLSENIHNLSILIYLTIQKAFQSNLPRIHGLGHVDYLLNNLEDLQTRISDSLDSVMDKLQLVQKEFESLQPFLQALSAARHNDLNEIQHCATQLISKAQEVEYIVDAWISEKAPTWCLERWILQITEEITLIRAEVARLHEKKMDWDALNTVTAQTSNLARSPMMNEEIVGFVDVIEKLRDQLIKGTKERDVVSIVGMPGLGKMTLAYRLYYDRDEDANPSSHLSGCVQLAHRMCIYGEGYDAGDWSSCLSHVVPIILHNNRLSVGVGSHIFRSFKFLEVLDMEFTRINSFSFDLVYLRYFSAELSHFSNEAGCWELETLKLKSLGEMSLPLTLWEMDKLRHLQISNCSFTSDIAEELIENSEELHNLKTLSTPCFSSAQEAELIQELRCNVKGSELFRTD